MRSLPLFHRIAGQKVTVLGAGAMAEPKRRLVERAGGTVVDDLQQGLDCGVRLAFIAHENQARCEDDAIRLRCAGVLVNVVDRPDLCDFTTPSLLERDPVLIAVGTSGASAGLAKQLRLRLETMLPQGLGALAAGLASARAAIRGRWPDPAGRRRALDAALAPGGPLDPLGEGGPERIADWLAGGDRHEGSRVYEFTLWSDDPDDLTLRQARLLGTADAIIADPAVPATILDRARADAARFVLPHEGPVSDGLVVILRRG